MTVRVRAPARDQRGLKILHIEDNPENRMLVRALLEPEGYQVVDAEDGLSGIEAALREEPALILLDINLPGVDGYEVGVILKSFPSLSAKPIVAVTAYAMEGDRQRTLVAGCDGYIQKPIDADTFAGQVAEFLHGKREKVAEIEAGPYLRELNQRLVYRLVQQVEELKRLNQHFVRRAVQLEDLHGAVQDITSEMGVKALLERLLPALAGALSTLSLTVELADPVGVRVSVKGETPPRPRGVLPGSSAAALAEWTEVEWTLPLAVRGRHLGVMIVHHLLPAGAKSDEEQLLKIVANQVAIAVENARLYGDMVQRAAEEESLVEAGRLVTGTLELPEVLHRVAALVQARLTADLVRIWLREPDGTLKFYAGAGQLRGTVDLAALVFAPGEGFVGQICEQRTPLAVTDLPRDPRTTFAHFLGQEGLVSLLGVPLLVQGEAVGVLMVMSRRRREFTPTEVALAEALATSAAAAIRNARLYAETQERLEAEREARGRLEASETRYRELFENAIDLVYVHDLEGSIQAVNRAGLRMTGYALDEIISMNLMHLMAPDDAARARALIERMVAGELAREVFTFDLIRKNGTRAVVECAARVIHQAGRPVAIQGVARDITARRMLERRQAAFVEIVKELSAEDDFDRLFSLIGRRVCELLEADGTVISLVEGEDLVLRGAYGIEHPERLIPRHPIAASEIARVLRDQQPYASADMREDPHWQESLLVRELGFRACLDVPIVLRGEVIGVLGVLHRTPRAFGADDTQLLVALAEHTAVALDRTNLVKNLESRLRETETLLAVSQAAGSVHDVAEIARRTVREMVRALGADVGGAWRRRRREELVPVAGYRVPKEILDTLAHSGIALDSGIGQRLTQLKETIALADSASDGDLDHPFARLLPHKSFLAVPMMVQGEVIGAFTLVWVRRPHRFRADELRLVEGIARQAAIAIENARLLEAEREASERLTVSETRYRDLFENVMDIVYLHDLHGRILEINEAGVRASGYARDELLQMSLLDFLAPDDREQAAQMVRRMVSGERVVEAFVAEFIRKDGTRLILESVGRAVFKDGVPVAILGSARDITVRRRLERRQEALVALSRELATEIDPQRLLPRIADEARRLMGMDSAMLLLLEGDRLVIRGASEIEPELQQAEPLSVVRSLTGVAVRERRPLVYANLGADPGWRATPLVRQFGYRAMLAVPLTVKEKTLGVLKILHREPRQFPYEEIEFLRALATQAALAIDNARLFAAQKEEAEISAGLLRLAEAIEGVQDLDQVLDSVVRTTPELLGVSQCLLFLFNPGDQTLIPTAASGLPDELQAAFRALRAQDLPAVLKALRTQDPVIVEESDADFRVSPVMADVFSVRAMLIIPLVSGGRLMGALAVHSPGQCHDFTLKEISLARGIAAHAAVALDKARLFQQTQTRLRETETLLNITQALSSTLDPTETMRRVAREIARTLGADMVGAYLADADQASLRPIAGYRVPKELHDRFMQNPIPIRGHQAMEEAWQRRQALWSSDVAADPRIDQATIELFPHQSLLFVPMIVKGEAIGGFFVVWWTERRQFSPEEVRLVEGISDQAAMFIENARLYSEATRRRREAEELARLARMLTESLDASDVGERIVESALVLIGGTFSVLRLLEPDGSLKLIAAKGDPQTVATLPAVVPAGWGVTGRALAEGTPVWSSNVIEDSRISFPEEARERLAALGTPSILAVPLRVKREVIGTLGIGASQRHFADAEVALLQTFADQAAIALENSRLYSDLRTALRAVEESQQRIVQGERLRALGEMAGGVAHDFNNVLAIIVGRAEVLLNETVDAELQRQLNVIIKVALDAAQTVKRIQEFTRMRRARPFQPVDINQIVDEIVEVTRSRWKDEAQSKGIKYELAVETHPIQPLAGDPSEIREALTNIIFNALDAMPEGGQITLRTGVEGDQVVCSITDTGVGMSEDVRQRIFDPFFTTKGERGTGLGLSVVYGIVSRHSGEIDVQSRLGHGTTFTIQFPIGSQADTAAPARPVPRPKATGRILVIDDEPEVCDVLRDLLTRDGHQVVICSDGESALGRLEQEAFDLVITDLGMPGVSGWEVARLAKQRRPGTPVAMVTGWGDRIDPHEAEARGVDHIVAKPFKRDSIREVVAVVLGSRSR